MTFSRLTRNQMHPRSGCLSKLPAPQLEELLEDAYRLAFGAEAPPHPMEDPKDCASVDLGGSTLLLTTEIIPLVGVDPIIAGRIAVLHAMSDVYACGGIPKWCLANLILKHDYAAEFNKALLAGILQAVRDEGAQLLGGHTIIGEEAMAGIVVAGVRSSPVALSKKGGVAGDHLLLSKPLGVGIVTRNYRLGLCSEADWDEAIRFMTTSNREASEKMVLFGARAATDVTGFGLLGHLAQMLDEGQGAELFVKSIPLLDGVKRPLPDAESMACNLGNLDYVRSIRSLKTEFQRRSWLLFSIRRQTGACW